MEALEDEALLEKLDHQGWTLEVYYITPHPILFLLSVRVSR